MRLKDEIEFYDKVMVSAEDGEIETWDSTIFPNVIRKRETELILGQIESLKPKRVLDFGCGAGWISRVLSSKRYSVIGIDASGSLIRAANNSSPESSNFVVGDGMKLPFGDNTFDLVIGMAIFHHLGAKTAFLECQRVSSNECTLLLMEPNKLNPFAALGRMVTNVQTEDEDPFYPWRLVKVLNETGWIVKEIKYLFPYSFGLSYLLKKLLRNKQVPNNTCRPIEISEKFLETIPGLNRLCWTMFVVATKNKTVGQ